MLTRDAWEFTTEDWQLVLDQRPRSLHQARLNAASTLVRHKLLGSRQHPKLDSLSIEWTLQATRAEIHTRLSDLAAGQFGEIIRVKGFIHCGWPQLAGADGA